MPIHETLTSVPIIGADAELQNSLRYVVKQKRTESSGTRSVNAKVAQFKNNKRKIARYPITNSVIAYPVLDSREIATCHALVGIGLNIGTGGMQVLVDSIEPYLGLEILVGVERTPGDYHFCAGLITSVREVQKNTFEAGIEFRGYWNEILSCEQIVPVLDREQMRFLQPFPETNLASLCRVGAANSVPMDSVLVCPHCRGIPTIRTGCSMCLSNNVKASRMIHHFACANVDFVEAFEQEDELCCQKCRTRRMVVGADYEYLNGPEACCDCGQSSLTKIDIGHCLSCELRFPMEMAHEIELMGYRVKRLDILDLISVDH
ncbi:MAG: hypothetical protein ACI87E_004416 [Mariniblastus sp.]|jgi:hypothetical protein